MHIYMREENIVQTLRNCALQSIFQILFKVNDRLYLLKKQLIYKILQI